MNFKINLQTLTLCCPILKSDLKCLEFDIRIFPGISGSGFFPEKKLARFCALKNTRPFCSFCYQTVLHQSFCYLAEAGRYEKCKKHTFLALITIFLKNVINKNCSEFNKIRILVRTVNFLDFRNFLNL